jgi:hypothetical protein
MPEALRHFTVSELKPIRAESQLGEGTTFLLQIPKSI